MSTKNLFYFLATAALIVAVLIMGASVFKPLAFGVFFALAIAPLTNWIYKKINLWSVSIVCAFLIVFIPLTGLFVGLGYQLVTIAEEMPNVQQEFGAKYQDWLNRINGVLPEEATISQEDVFQGIKNLIQQPLNYLSSAASVSVALLGGVGLTILFCFFWLYYRIGFHNFILQQTNESNRDRLQEALSEIQEVSKGYIMGLFIVMLILGALNTVAFYFIGVKYAFFWGFLAGVLAVVPYVGSFLGGLFPFLYTLLTSDYSLQPVLVVAAALVIQAIEGNFVTPFIVGDKVNVNPFFAILALLFGSLIWGIAGMILAMPAIGIFSSICNYVPRLKPIGHILSTDLRGNGKAFLKRWDKPRFRIGESSKSK